MARIVIDGQAFEVDEGRNLLDVALSLGFDLPYFCWHAALGSVGACRQCAVKQYEDENDTRGRITMACMTPAEEGTRIAIDEPEARALRASVIEWLMVNHPHDCPVCDEGGECHLQDMTVMTGHVRRRYRFDKRTFENQDLGPFVNHEMNRCITCYRCVRFYRDYAGGDDLHAFASKNHVYFGRHESGVLENEFSGNLVEVCPTGVFTDKTLRFHYTRKWDLQTAPSVCHHCAVGCNITPGERYGTLRRVLNRYNSEVNGYFLCDRGRFGYEFVNSEQRLREPLYHGRHLSGRDAVAQLAALLREQPGRVIGIGSPRASLEGNYALRELVGPEAFYQGVGAEQAGLVRRIIDILSQGPARTPSLHEVEQADAVLVLGEDLANTAPRAALALRQATRQRAWQRADQLGIPRWQDGSVREATPGMTSPLFLLLSHASRLDDIATAVQRVPPQEIARFGHAVAEELGAPLTPPPGLSEPLALLARQVADTLRSARRPLIVSGMGLGSGEVIEAAANVAWALHAAGTPADLLYALPECNSLGSALLGGGDLEQALDELESGRAATVVVLENDLYRHATLARVDAALARAQLVVLDGLHTPTASRASARLPAATFAEADGTLVSGEGRAQRFFQVFQPAHPIQESWRWLAALLDALGRPPGWQGLDDLLAAIATAFPRLAGIVDAAPAATFRTLGQRMPRQPWRYSGRTAMFADRTMQDPAPPPDPDAPLSFSMEGAGVDTGCEIPTQLVSLYWRPGWNSHQAVNKFQEEMGGELRGGDPGVRLLEPGAPPARWFTGAPPRFHRRAGEWLLIPLHPLFGSDELSHHAPALATRIPLPWLGLHPEDAAEAGLTEGTTVDLVLTRAPAGETFRLPLRLDASLPRGVAAVPFGLPGFTIAGLPCHATLHGPRDG